MKDAPGAIAEEAEEAEEAEAAEAAEEAVAAEAAEAAEQAEEMDEAEEEAKLPSTATLGPTTIALLTPKVEKPAGWYWHADPDTTWAIEAVHSVRVHQRKLEFLIKWEGWHESHNTWEPMAHLVAPEAVAIAMAALLRALRRSLQCIERRSKRRERRLKAARKTARKAAAAARQTEASEGVQLLWAAATALAHGATVEPGATEPFDCAAAALAVRPVVVKLVGASPLRVAVEDGAQLEELGAPTAQPQRAKRKAASAAVEMEAAVEVEMETAVLEASERVAQPEAEPTCCQRNPLCTRGFRHNGHGGLCSIPSAAEPKAEASLDRPAVPERATKASATTATAAAAPTRSAAAGLASQRPPPAKYPNSRLVLLNGGAYAPRGGAADEGGSMTADGLGSWGLGGGDPWAVESSVPLGVLAGLSAERCLPYNPTDWLLRPSPVALAATALDPQALVASTAPSAAALLRTPMPLSDVVELEAIRSAEVIEIQNGELAAAATGEKDEDDRELCELWPAVACGLTNGPAQPPPQTALHTLLQNRPLMLTNLANLRHVPKRPRLAERP